MAPWRRLLLLTAVVSTVMIHAERARAQSAAGIAQERFREGTAHYDDRRYAEARAAFMQAYALDPKPRYLLFLGHSELRVGEAALAATHIAQFLRENPDAAEEDRQEADIDLAAARAKVTEVTLVAPDGMEVFVADRSLGKAPFDDPVFIAPGIRTLGGRLGEETREREVDAKPGDSITVDLTTSAVAPAPNAPVEDAEADAFMSEAPPPSGGRKPFVSWFLTTPLAWVGAGLTGVGLIGGTTFALTSKTHFDKANRISNLLLDTGPSPCDPPRNADAARACRDFDEARDTGNTQRTLAIVGFSVAGAAAVGTIVYYFVDPKARRTEQAALSVVPGALPGGAFVHVSSAF